MAETARILLVEDDPRIAEDVMAVLQPAFGAVDWVDTGQQGLEAACLHAYKVLILDRLLPDQDGLDTLRALRGHGVMSPALVLSALGETYQKVEGLEGGADDYMSKPFALDELRARVAVLMRRDVPHPEVLLCGPLQIWSKAQTAYRDGVDLRLSPREFDLLLYLARNEGILITRRMILQHVFGLRHDPGTNVVDVHINRLRRKLDHGFAAPMIQTIRGQGYRLERPA